MSVPSFSMKGGSSQRASAAATRAAPTSTTTSKAPSRSSAKINSPAFTIAGKWTPSAAERASTALRPRPVKISGRTIMFSQSTRRHRSDLGMGQGRAVRRLHGIRGGGDRFYDRPGAFGTKREPRVGRARGAWGARLSRCTSRATSFGSGAAEYTHPSSFGQQSSKASFPTYSMGRPSTARPRRRPG